MVEYDGLPLAFYRDFAKQARDEMRHALLFFRLGVDLLPSFLAWPPPDHPLVPGARRFAETGSGLPVPRERNLYELAGHDEASHARFGKIGFEHLVPEKANRRLDLQAVDRRAGEALGREMVREGPNIPRSRPASPLTTAEVAS